MQTSQAALAASSFSSWFLIFRTQDGVYKLVSFSDSYSNYLSAMGVPWYVLPLVLSSSETIDIEVTEDGAKMATSTGG